MPNQEEIQNQINISVSITRPRIAAAKEFIVKEFRTTKINTADNVLNIFLHSVEVTAPEKVIIHPSVDPTPSINQVINNISWTLAFSEAIWSLIHSNFLIPLDSTVRVEEPTLEWTSVVPGSGGMSSGWSFPQWEYSLPHQLEIAPSQALIDHDYLADPDLFLKNLDIAIIHDGVAEALQDSILCFRAELFTPCLAMLTKAIEGAWGELGLALIGYLDESDRDKLKKQTEILTSDFSSIARIIRTVVDIYGRQDLFVELIQQSKVKLEDLKNAMIWADCVRESRNVVHYGNQSLIPNDFEKVATLLLGAPNHFKTLYRIMEITGRDNEGQS